LLLIRQPEVLKSVISLTEDSSESIAKDACLALVNVSSDEPGARALLTASECSDSTKVSKQLNIVI
jgi:hypothetical protein